jgi:hypothetical protein
LRIDSFQLLQRVIGRDKTLARGVRGYFLCIVEADMLGGVSTLLQLAGDSSGTAPTPPESLRYVD